MEPNKHPRNLFSGIFIFYCLIFMVFFIQFPLSNSFTGDLDTMANISIYKYLGCKINALLSGSECGSFNYPMNHIMVAYGADFGLGVFYNFFALFLDDVWANWIFTSFLYATNALGVAFIAHQLFNNKISIFFSGLLFSFSQFSLGNIENPNAMFFFLSFLSVSYLIRYMNSTSWADLIKAFLLGGLQIYFSPTVFVSWVLITSIICLYTLWHLNDLKKMLWQYFIVATIVAVIIFPYIYFFVISDLLVGYHNPIQKNNIIFMGLDLLDLIRVLPNNMLFNQVDTTNNYIDQIKSAYLGLSMWSLGFIGLLYTRKDVKMLLLLIFFVGLSFSFGSHFVLNKEALFPAPLYILYEYFHFADFIRMPVRFFFIVVLVVALFSGNALAKLFSKSYLKILAVLLMVLFSLENVPFVMKKYDHNYMVSKEPVYQILDKYPPGSKKIAHLPSALFSGESDKYEYVYMYWQRLHHQNILNGGSAFFSAQRLENNALMSDFRKDNNLTKLIDANQLDFIIWHENIGGKEDLQQYDARLIPVAGPPPAKLYKVEDGNAL